MVGRMARIPKQLFTTFTTRKDGTLETKATTSTPATPAYKPASEFSAAFRKRLADISSRFLLEWLVEATVSLRHHIGSTFLVFYQIADKFNGLFQRGGNAVDLELLCRPHLDDPLQLGHLGPEDSRGDPLLVFHDNSTLGV